MVSELPRPGGRRQAAALLGIECFAPRRHLPGASPHPLCAARPSAVAASPAPAAAPQRRPPAVATVEVAYCLVAARCGGVLAVDDVVDGALSPLWGALLGQLLKACGLPATPLDWRLLRWPLAGGGALAHSADAGRDAAQAFIERRAGGAAWILLMGGVAGRQLAIADESAMPAPVLRCESLRACLDDPLRKAALWPQLRALRRVAASGLAVG